MKIKKKLKTVLQVLATCPAMYNQNIKDFGYDMKRCYKAGFVECTPFTLCPHWKKRLNCWTNVYDMDEWERTN